MTSVASASSSSASPSSSSFPSSSLSSALSASPSDVSARLGVLAATSGDFADAAHKAVALDGLRHRCIDGQRTREQAALLCTQLIHGDVVQPSLLTTFRRWVQADAYAGLRAPLLELLIGLCLTPLTRDSLTPGHCQSLMAFALFVVRSEAGSRVREKALELMDRLLSIHRIKWDTTTDDADHITPAGIIDMYAALIALHSRLCAAHAVGLLANGHHHIHSPLPLVLLCLCQSVQGAGAQEVCADGYCAWSAVLSARWSIGAVPRLHPAQCRPRG